jgi:hypothetical protein
LRGRRVVWLGGEEMKRGGGAVLKRRKLNLKIRKIRETEKGLAEKNLIKIGPIQF